MVYNVQVMIASNVQMLTLHPCEQPRANADSNHVTRVERTLRETPEHMPTSRAPAVGSEQQDKSTIRHTDIDASA